MKQRSALAVALSKFKFPLEVRPMLARCLKVNMERAASLPAPRGANLRPWKGRERRMMTEAVSRA